MRSPARPPPLPVDRGAVRAPPAMPSSVKRGVTLDTLTRTTSLRFDPAKNSASPAAPSRAMAFRTSRPGRRRPGRTETPGDRTHYSDLWQGIAREEPGSPRCRDRDETVSYGRLAAEAAHSAGTSRTAASEPATPRRCSSTTVPRVPGVHVGLPRNRRRARGHQLPLPRGGGTRAAGRLQRDASSVRADILERPRARGGRRDWMSRSSPSTTRGPRPRAPCRTEAVIAAGGALPAAAPRGAELRLYTGGTTGRSPCRGLGHGHAARGPTGSRPGASSASSRRTTSPGRSASRWIPPTPRPITLPLPPLLHGTAQSTTMATLALGGTVVLHAAAHLDIEEALRLAIAERASRLIVAGDAVALPLAEAAERRGDRTPARPHDHQLGHALQRRGEAAAARPRRPHDRRHARPPARAALRIRCHPRRRGSPTRLE